MSSSTPLIKPNLPLSITPHIPNTTISATALSLAYANLPLPVFNHSLRVFLLAKHLITHENTSSKDYLSLPDLDLLFTACIFHDMGICNCHNGPQRFEVEGADAAVSFLQSHHITQEKCHDVWTAIALHTSPGIAERISPLARIVRLAVLMDFGSPLRDEFAAREYCDEIEEMLPRSGVEKCLGDAVVRQAVKRPEKAPAVSWPNALLKAHLKDPDFDGVNPEFFGEEMPGRGL
ncbi:metal dependent phosphohydrolase, partial [Aureobasidium melanogenum]